MLRLIAAGCTSQEIADELVISIHTVERHITHVYQKIGARGRAEATAYASSTGSPLPAAGPAQWPQNPVDRTRVP